MAKKSIEEKIYNGKTYRTSAFLKKKLYLSAESSRRILKDYEHNPDLGVNPKFYDEKIINQIIEDYGNNESKRKSIEKRKRKLEEERALQEKNNRAVGGYGIPRPLDIVEADDRLNGDDGYLE